MGPLCRPHMCVPSAGLEEGGDPVNLVCSDAWNLLPQALLRLHSCRHGFSICDSVALSCPCDSEAVTGRPLISKTRLGGGLD